MTPKEKAQELYSIMEDSITDLEGHEWWESAKRCAIKAVRFAIEQIGTSCSDCQDEQTKKLNFLIELEQEIEKL